MEDGLGWAHGSAMATANTPMLSHDPGLFLNPLKNKARTGQNTLPTIDTFLGNDLRRIHNAIHDMIPFMVTI
jgi:hypothetical protein